MYLQCLCVLLLGYTSRQVKVTVNVLIDDNSFLSCSTTYFAKSVRKERCDVKNHEARLIKTIIGNLIFEQITPNFMINKVFYEQLIIISI